MKKIFLILIISLSLLTTYIKPINNFKYYGDIETAKIIKKDNRTFLIISITGTIIISTIALIYTKKKIKL